MKTEKQKQPSHEHTYHFLMIHEEFPNTLQLLQVCGRV